MAKHHATTKPVINRTYVALIAVALVTILGVSLIPSYADAPPVAQLHPQPYDMHKAFPQLELYKGEGNRTNAS